MSPWWQTLALWLADFLLLATLLLTAAFACLAVVRQPARRLAVGWATLISLAILAVLIAIPGWPRLSLGTLENPPQKAASIPDQALGSYRLTHPISSKTATLARATGATDQYEFDYILSEGDLHRFLKAAPRKQAPSSQTATFPIRASTTPTPDPSAGDAKPAIPGTSAGAKMDWPAVASALFVIGASLSLLWLGVGAVQVQRLWRHGREAPAELQALLRQVVGNEVRPPRLLISSHIGQPVALGTLRPVIVLPAGSVDRVAEADLAAVLAHEWAHIRRGDLWLLALSRWLLTLLFAHPLYWWLRARIREDQEALADAAAAGPEGAIDYAATLLHWVRLGKKRRGAAAALALWGKPSELKRRITMLLHPRFPVETRCPVRWRWGALSAMGLGVLALSVLTVRPVPPAAAEPPAAAKATTPAKKEASKPPKVTVKAAENVLQADVEFKAIALDVAMPARVANQAPAPPAIKAGQVFAMAGRVENVAKKPVSQAAVTVIAWTWPSSDAPQVLGQGQTDARGRYRLKVKMPAGNPQVAAVVNAKGYGLGWSFYQAGMEGHVRLAPEQVLRGRLIDLQGEGAAGVTVQVCRIGLRPAGAGGYYRLSTLNAVPPKPRPVRVLAFTPDGKVMMQPPQTAEVQPPAMVFVKPPTKLPFWPASVTTDARGRFSLHGIGKGQGVGLQIHDPRYAVQAIDVAPPKDKDAEVTRVVSPARLIEGTVTDADTGKPIAGARVHIPSSRNGLLSGEIFFDVAGRGDADWKGRRFRNSGFQSFVLIDAGGSAGSDELPPIDIGTDKQGRFHIPLALAGSYQLQVSAPEGEPYFPLTQGVGWPKAAAKQSLKITLHRGVWVRGKVTEAASGKPLVGASVDFWGPAVKVPQGVQAPRTIQTGADGTFRVLTPPGTWHLLVNGAVSEFVVQKVPAVRLVGEQPLRVNGPNGPVITVDAKDSKNCFYPDGYKIFDLKPRADAQDVEIKLRREVIKGKLIGPDGKPAARAVMFYRHPLAFPDAAQPKDAVRRVFLDVLGRQPTPSEVGMPSGPNEPAVAPIKVKDGWFEIPVRDVEADYQLFFLDARHELGAVARVSAKKARAKEPIVQLSTTGSAKARFVDAKGKPLAKYRPDLWLLLPPGPHAVSQFPTYLSTAPRANAAFSPDGQFLVTTEARLWQPMNNGSALYNQILLRQADPLHYAQGPVTDVLGEVTFPALIAGADYRLVTSDGQMKAFKVESGKTLDLAKFVIKPPAPPQQIRPPAAAPLAIEVKPVPAPTQPKPTKEKPKK
jgi:beta-lactamase regulating signal transducer with metallopeptidase domain